MSGYAAPNDADVGSSLDVETRESNTALNQGMTGMGPDTPYTGPIVSTYPYQSEA